MMPTGCLKYHHTFKHCILLWTSPKKQWILQDKKLDLNWPIAAYKDNIAHLCAQKGILKCARCHCQDLLKTKRDQSCGEDLLSLTKCPCKAGDLVQDKQQGRQSRCGDCGSSARGQMKGCNSLAEQGRKDRWGGRPQLQAKDVNTAKMGRGWGRGWGPVPHQA